MTRNHYVRKSKEPGKKVILKLPYLQREVVEKQSSELAANLSNPVYRADKRVD